MTEKEIQTYEDLTEASRDLERMSRRVGHIAMKMRAAQDTKEVDKTAQNTESAAIALCVGLVNWYDRRNLSLGQNFADIIEKARSIAQQAHVS